MTAFRRRLEATMPGTKLSKRASAVAPTLPTPYLPSPHFPSLASPARDLAARANESIRAAFTGAPDVHPVWWYPAINVSEDRAELTLTAELPGLKPGDVSIDFLDDVLAIRGEKKMEPGTAPFGPRRRVVRERGFGSFHRVLQLPVEVAGDRITAELNDGVLTVHLPKADATRSRHRRIAILEK